MTNCAIPAQDHHRQELILAARSQVPGDSSVALSWALWLPWFLDIRNGFHGSRRKPHQKRLLLRYWYTSMRQAEERCICSRRITNSSSLHPQLQPRNGGPGPTSPSKVSPERAPASSDLPAKVSSWSALARSDVHTKISPGRAPAKICH